MKQTENAAPGAREPESQAYAESPNMGQESEPGAPRSGARPSDLIAPDVPLTRSPYDVWHPEGYLIACLTRQHGWVCTEPGRLAKYKGGR